MGSCTTPTYADFSTHTAIGQSAALRVVVYCARTMSPEHTCSERTSAVAKACGGRISMPEESFDALRATLFAPRGVHEALSTIVSHVRHATRSGSRYTHAAISVGASAACTTPPAEFCGTNVPASGAASFEKA